MRVDDEWLKQYLSETSGTTNPQDEALTHLGGGEKRPPLPVSDTKASNARTGKHNQAQGRIFEDRIASELAQMFYDGRGLVYKVDAKSKVIKVHGSLQIIYEAQGENGPPIHPPDFLGVLDGKLVAFDAKVRRSGDVYYISKRDRHQCRGLSRLRMTTDASKAFVGYLILWPGDELGFCPVTMVDTATKYGAVRREHCVMGESFTDIFELYHKRES